jgi:hypothetical protein
MMQNVEKIAATTKAIGRPKVDYSKISQICISSYNIETCEPSDPLTEY